MFKPEKDDFWVAFIFTEEIKNTFNILPSYVREGGLVCAVSDEVHSGKRYYILKFITLGTIKSKFSSLVSVTVGLIVIQTDPRLLLFFIPVPPILDNQASTAPNIYLYDVNLHSLPSEYNQLQSSSGS